MIKLIVGLGNPGDQYKNTRHNVGFVVADVLKSRWQTISCSSKFEAEICEVHFDFDKVFVMKPETFMNESGKPVSEFSRYYKISSVDTLVIYDDVDLPLGNLRLSQGGSAGGHNGVKSIIEQSGPDFTRLRIGIGDNRAAGLKAEDYVLQKFKPEEEQLIKKAIDQAADVIALLIENKDDEAQQKIREFNKSI